MTLHMVASLDGFIARHDNDISWLESPEDAYQDGVVLDADEAAKALESIDCYVLGSRTYEHALELGWPYGDTPTVVLTSRELQSTRESVEFFSRGVEELFAEILVPRYPNVWLVGGAMLCRSFLDLGLVDKVILSIAPVTLGDGLRLFDGAEVERRWRLQDVVAYKTGFVELTYDIESTNT